MLPDNNYIKQIGKESGADLVGIASIDRFCSAPTVSSPLEKLKTCKSVIVLAGTFAQETLVKDTVSYTAIRNGMVEKMDGIATTIAKMIKQYKVDSKPIRSLGGKWVDGRFYGHISLKHAGEQAGLGVISRNYLLTNNQYGNLLWLSAVLTSLELEPDPKANYTVCTGCKVCVDTCPASALDNEKLFGQRACYRSCYIVKKGVLDLKCWNCRNVCPSRFGINP